MKSLMKKDVSKRWKAEPGGMCTRSTNRRGTKRRATRGTNSHGTNPRDKEMKSLMKKDVSKRRKADQGGRNSTGNGSANRGTNRRGTKRCGTKKCGTKRRATRGTNSRGSNPRGKNRVAAGQHQVMDNGGATTAASGGSTASSGAPKASPCARDPRFKNKVLIVSVLHSCFTKRQPKWVAPNWFYPLLSYSIRNAYLKSW